MEPSRRCVRPPLPGGHAGLEGVASSTAFRKMLKFPNRNPWLRQLPTTDCSRWRSVTRSGSAYAVFHLLLTGENRLHTPGSHPPLLRQTMIPASGHNCHPIVLLLCSFINSKVVGFGNPVLDSAHEGVASWLGMALRPPEACLPRHRLFASGGFQDWDSQGGACPVVEGTRRCKRGR